MDTVGDRQADKAHNAVFAGHAMEEAAANTQLNISNLQDALNAAEAQSKKIAELLATTDVVKNSIADPKATEEAINEEIDLMFDSISDLTK